LRQKPRLAPGGAKQFLALAEGRSAGKERGNHCGQQKPTSLPTADMPHVIFIRIYSSLLKLL